MIKEAISKLAAREDLSFKETEAVFEEIFGHKALASQIAAFLTSLKMKGETEDEIWAAASVVRRKAVKLNISDSFLGVKFQSQPVIDTCGTGGSGLNKFNVSTATAFVVGACGVKVAKHGNRAMSSSCGSADVLEALGIDVSVRPSVMEEALKKTGIGFLYAPLYHPALKEAAQIRKDIGIRTIFNILGPLCSPVSAGYQLLGVYDRSLVSVLARVLKKLGTKKALVVCGKDVADEISLSGPTQACFLNGRRIKDIILTPSSFGLKKVKVEELLVDDAKMSAEVIKGIMDGQKGPCRDVVLANASACFYILGKAGDFKQGVKIAAELIDSKKVKEKYLEFKNFIADHA